jgi:hypothetical protein
MDIFMLQILFALLSLILLNSTVFACSAPPPESVKIAFKQSKAVYLAMAKSIKVIPRNNEKFTWIEQEVEFEVLESWKGDIKVGEKILFNTVVSSGCGASVDNYDHWLELPAESGGESSYPKLSGIWLIYSHDPKYRKLEPLGRTQPFEFGGARDMKDLYKLSQQNRSNSKHL